MESEAKCRKRNLITDHARPEKLGGFATVLSDVCKDPGSKRLAHKSPYIVHLQLFRSKTEKQDLEARHKSKT